MCVCNRYVRRACDGCLTAANSLSLSLPTYLPTCRCVSPTPYDCIVYQVLDWLGDNASQIDSKEMETQFKTTFPILLNEETVELAFKSGRDTKMFTNKRILLVDVKGLMGKKIEFLTILYPSIHGFYVQTAGKLFDRDTELRLYTNMVGNLYQINQDFSKSKANLWVSLLMHWRLRLLWVQCLSVWLSLYSMMCLALDYVV